MKVNKITSSVSLGGNEIFVNSVFCFDQSEGWDIFKVRVFPYLKASDVIFKAISSHSFSVSM